MKIKISEILEKKKLLEKLAQLLPNSTLDGVLFFPIELEEQLIENESGISMLKNTYESTTGINSLITYGLVPSSNGVEICAAYYDRSGVVQINMNDFLQVIKALHNDFDVTPFSELECILLKQKSLVFSFSEATRNLNE